VKSIQQTMILSMPNMPPEDCSVQTIVSHLTSNTEAIEKICEERCGHDSAKAHTLIEETSDVLSIVLKRYDNALCKIDRDAHPDVSINVKFNDGKSHCKYRLKSIAHILTSFVCLTSYEPHHGSCFNFRNYSVVYGV
jgi:hypothetical protein